MSDDDPLLDLRGGERVFGHGPGAVHALAGVSLQVRAGRSLAITGRSGSGKSTLLNALGLLDTLSAGEYLVCGRRTSQLHARDLDELRARTFGFVFQAFHLAPYLSVYENVEMGLTYAREPRARRHARIDDLIEQVGLSHRRDAAVATLSGGEKQRSAIARALVHHPAVVLADEPTGNLDDASAANVLSLFDQVTDAGVALVIVTHDAQTAARCDAQIHIRDGKVAP